MCAWGGEGGGEGRESGGGGGEEGGSLCWRRGEVRKIEGVV